MRIFVLGDSFANNLFAKAYRDIIKYNTTNPNLNLSQISKYLISLQNENIENAKWWTDWLEEWGYEIVNLGNSGCSNYNILYQDNKSTILLKKNGKLSSSKRTKHMDVSYFFVTDRIQRGDVTTEWCPTSEMIANYMTKPFQGKMFTKFRYMVMGIKSVSWNLKNIHSVVMVILLKSLIRET
jgi:hypothetical protein